MAAQDPMCDRAQGFSGVGVPGQGIWDAGSG